MSRTPAKKEPILFRGTQATLRRAANRGGPGALGIAKCAGTMKGGARLQDSEWLALATPAALLFWRVSIVDLLELAMLARPGQRGSTEIDFARNVIRGVWNGSGGRLRALCDPCMVPAARSSDMIKFDRRVIIAPSDNQLIRYRCEPLGAPPTECCVPANGASARLAFCRRSWCMLHFFLLMGACSSLVLG